MAIWAPNDRHWVLAALGALGAGGTLVPVSTRFTGPEALDVISRSGARALFVAGDFLGVDRLGALRAAAARGRAAAAWTGSRWWCGSPERLGRVRGAGGLAGRGPPEGSAGRRRRRAAAVRPEDVSDIMFTSGTTGRSKGAMTSHERTLARGPGLGRVRAADRRRTATWW